MKAATFLIENRKTRISSCEEFQLFAVSISLKDRPKAIGYPFGKLTWSVKVFINSVGTINPYWVRYFSCVGNDVTPEEAMRLLKPQLRIPITRRAIGDVDSSVRKPTPKLLFKEPVIPPSTKSRDPRFPSSPDFDGYGNISTTDGYGRSNTTSKIVTHFRSTKSSVKTPGFWKMKKADRPWNNFSSSKTLIKESDGGRISSVGRPPCDGTWSTSTGFARSGGMTQVTNYLVNGPRGQPTSNFAQQSMSKALSNVKQQKVNLAQAFAEREQTVGLVYNNVKRLVSLAIALKKGNVKGAKDLLLGSKGRDKRKQISVFNRDGTHVVGRKYVHTRVGSTSNNLTPEQFASLWLEFQYGWRPLLSDIYGACELIADTYYRKPSVRFTGKARASTTYVELTGYYVPFGNASWCSGIKAGTWASQDTYKHDFRSNTVLEFREPESMRRVFSQTGITDPALLAWEVLPYSFVIDWFIPIGTYLENINATCGLDFVRGCTVTSFKTDLNSSQVQTKPGVGSCASGATGLWERKNRSVFYNNPYPSFPSFEPNLGTEKILSGISLLTQVFSRGKSTVR